MDNSFEFDEEYGVKVSPQLLTLKPFVDIMRKYKNKQIGIEEISFIVYLLHPKSDFADIRDEEEREKVILENMFRGSKIRIDKKTRVAIEFYKKRKATTKTNYLNAALDAIDKTTTFLRDIDYTKRTRGGALEYDPKKIIDIIKESPKLMKGIKELEEQINKDEETSGKLIGSGQKGMYED